MTGASEQNKKEYISTVAKDLSLQLLLMPEKVLSTVLFATIFRFTKLQPILLEFVYGNTYKLLEYMYRALIKINNSRFFVLIF